MKTSPSRGIISDHFRGVGTVTVEMVRQRARELAIINGHSPNHCTRQDMLDAERELTGANPALDDDDDPLINAAAWGEEPASVGHTVDRMEAADEQTIGEVLTEQGISEAEHDQMVQAAKSRQVLENVDPLASKAGLRIQAPDSRSASDDAPCAPRSK